MEWQAYQEGRLPEARLGHSSTLVETRASWVEDLLIIFGGLSAEKEALGDVSVLQVETHAWISPTLASTVFPSPRAFHGAAAHGTNLYIFGGHVFQKDHGVKKFQDLWCLSTDTWEWIQIPWIEDSPSPCPRDFCTLISLPGKRILLHGGLDPSEKKLDDTWIFDFNRQWWSKLEIQNGPKARHAHAMLRVDKQVLVCGGESQTGPLNDIWALRGVVDPTDETPCWVQLEIGGSAVSPRKAFAVAGLGMQLIFFGGHTSASGWFNRRSDVYHNDVTLMERRGSVSWQRPTVGGTLPAPREFHTLTAVDEKRLLLFGGGNGRSIFGDAFWLCMTDTQPDTSPPSTQGESQLGLSWSDDLHASATPMDAATTVTASELSATFQEDASPKYNATDNGHLSRDEARLQFNRLCKRLDARDVAHASNSSEELAFQQLGRFLDNGSTDFLPEEASSCTQFVDSRLESLARQYLATKDTEALRVSDISALLWDYKQISPRLEQGRPRNVNELLQAIDIQSDGRHRFLHLKAETLLIADTAKLHEEYKRLCGLMQT